MPIAAGVLYPFFGLLLSPMNRRRCDERQFRFCGLQCPATPGRKSVNSSASEKTPEGVGTIGHCTSLAKSDREMAKALRDIAAEGMAKGSSYLANAAAA